MTIGRKTLEQLCVLSTTQRDLSVGTAGKLIRCFELFNKTIQHKKTRVALFKGIHFPAASKLAASEAGGT